MRIHQRVRIDPSSPEATAACDRCQQLWNLNALQWQLQYYGMQLQSTGFLVCPTCLDVPQPQLKPIILPPDPEPVLNPRVFNYTNAETDYLSTEQDVRIVEQDEASIITQPNGNVMLGELAD